jgi:hypothetical protein
MDYSRNKKESSWELSRKHQRKKIVGFILIALPVIALIVVLVINNRELITGEAHRENPVGISGNSITPAGGSSVEDTETIDTGNPTKQDTLRKNKKKTGTNSSNRKTDVRPHLNDIQPKEEGDTYIKTIPERVTPKPRETPRNKGIREYSLTMPPFPCSIENRKDIVISLSLELFYKDSTFRSALLFHRNEIKVMVMRTVKSKVLAEMKIDVLEKELPEEINSVLKAQPVTGVKIHTIQIEKVSEK